MIILNPQKAQAESWPPNPGFGGLNSNVRGVRVEWKKKWCFPASKTINGILKEAFGWQSKGHRFESDILHLKATSCRCCFFYDLWGLARFYCFVNIKTSSLSVIDNSLPNSINIAARVSPDYVVNINWLEPSGKFV